MSEVKQQKPPLKAPARGWRNLATTTLWRGTPPPPPHGLYERRLAAQPAQGKHQGPTMHLQMD